MKNRFNYFTTANRLFWVLCTAILFFCLFRFDTFFNSADVAERIAASEKQPDTERDERQEPPQPAPETQKKFTWEWRSVASGKLYRLDFVVNTRDMEAAAQNRKSLDGFSTFPQVYSRLFENDAPLLNNMIEGYKMLARKNALNYAEAMEMVVSSVQQIPYTWVLDSNPSCGEILPTQDGPVKIPGDYCFVRPEPNGCCDGVNFGVYAPVEFATRKTGDCDTRSLFAYTILKRMGFDVAVMISEQEGHSVLGVQVPGIPGDGRRGNVGRASNYYLWELTAYGPVLGQNIPGSDWKIALQ